MKNKKADVYVGEKRRKRKRTGPGIRACVFHKKKGKLRGPKPKHNVDAVITRIGGKRLYAKCRKPAGEISLKNAVRTAETQKTAKITARDMSVVLLSSINLRIVCSSFFFQFHYISHFTKMRLKFGYKLLHLCNNRTVKTGVFVLPDGAAAEKAQFFCPTRAVFLRCAIAIPSYLW